MKKIILTLATFALLTPNFTLAEGTATHDTASDTTISTNAPAGTHSSDPTSKAIETQKENWNKIADKTGRDISYSHKYICDSSSSCITVDPPRFQR